MSIERYRALVDQLCIELSVPHTPLMYQAARIKVGDIDFTLFHDALCVPDGVLVHCSFGVLPQHARETILLRLLEAQRHLFGVCTPVFAHDASEDSILLMCRFGLHRDADAHAALELLQLLAGMARQWRADHFLFKGVVAGSGH